MEDEVTEEGQNPDSEDAQDDNVEESSESAEREPYSPDPMLGDLILGAIICLTLVPLWASPLTGMITILLSNLLSIPATPLFVLMSLVFSVVAFLYLYSSSYR